MSMGHSLGTSRWCGPGVTRALFLDAARPAAWTLVGGSGLVAVVTGIRLLWGGSAVPDPLTWLAVVLLSVVWSQSVVLPAAGVVGTVAALARWGDEGAWTGARASGGCGRSLLPAVLLIGLATSTATAGVTLVLEPIARRAGRRVLHDGLAEVALLPGRMVESGDLALRARRVRDGVGEEVFVARGPVVLTARTATVVRQGEDLALVLVDGEAAGGGEPPWSARWDEWTWPLPPTSSARIELSERGNRELAAAARRTEAAGGDSAYEWAVLFKRVLHPVAALLLPLALLPAGAGRRPALAVGVAGVGYLVAVRLGDHLAAAVGSWLSASTGLAFVVVWAVVAWWLWRDR